MSAKKNKIIDFIDTMIADSHLVIDNFYKSIKDGALSISNAFHYNMATTAAIEERKLAYFEVLKKEISSGNIDTIKEIQKEISNYLITNCRKVKDVNAQIDVESKTDIYSVIKTLLVSLE